MVIDSTEAPSTPGDGRRARWAGAVDAGAATAHDPSAAQQAGVSPRLLPTDAPPIEAAMGRDEARKLMALGQALAGAASNLRLIAVRQLPA